MTRDERTAHPIDDDDVARLVREVAAGWVMPPVRLDQPGWRERIRSPRARRTAGATGLLGRLGQAGAAAVALTIAATLAAVYLTGRPGPEAGKSNPPSTSPTDHSVVAPPGPEATPLPKLYLLGTSPAPTRVVVQGEDGEFSIADLSTGTLGSELTASSYGSRVRRAPNGDLVCLCMSADGAVYGQYTHMKATIERFDATGKTTSRDVVLDVSGAPDPRYEQVPEQPGHVSTVVSFSTDGRYAYVGWSARAHPSWRSGIVVVALDDGTIVQRLDLPATSDGTLDLGVFVDAPRVVGQAGNRAIIDRPKYSWGPVTAANAAYTPGRDVLSATVDAGGALGEASPLAGAATCGDDVTLAGPLPAGGVWLSCPHYDGSVLTTIRRLRADGTIAGDTSIYSSFVEGSTSAVSPDGTRLYIWDPIGLELNRVDLATGETTKAKAPAPTSMLDPLSAFGRWLAPSTFAKMFLQPGVALSPDGSRLYGIGIVGDPAAHDLSSSAGIVVFDTAAMTALGRWAPTADYTSLAVSADGSFVYAAGLPGVNGAGMPVSQGASITVFNAGDGSIRLIAGDLGRQMLSFTDTTLK